MTRPLAGLTWRNAATEALAGVTLLAIAVPLNIGYAQIAGLPATAGLFALVVPALVYAAIVSSRQLVASPDAAAAALVASSIGGLAVAGSDGYLTMAFAQAIICGIMLVLAAVFKLGFLANFLSKPILIGFVGGLALDILVGQAAKMLGVKVDSGGEFIEKVAALVGGLPTVNPWSLGIAAGSIVILLVGRWRARAVPWALLVLVLSTIVVGGGGLESRGVAVLGDVDSGPPALTWPSLEWSAWLALIPSAMALALVTMAEGLLVARNYGEKHGYRTSPNRDLLAFGAANVAAGATGGFAVGSSTSRTAAMDQAGSRTQLPTVVAALGTLLLLLFGTDLLAHIPSPAIGAIVSVAVVPLLGFREFRQLWIRDRFEFLIGAACFLVTLTVGAIPGILVAFTLALINLTKRAAHPPIDILAADDSPDSSLLNPAPLGSTTAPGIVVIRLAAPLFFANAAVFTDAVERAVGDGRDVRSLVLDLEAVTDIDVTGADAFTAVRDWLHARGVELVLSRGRDETIDRLRHLGLIDHVQRFATNREALAALARARGTEESTRRIE